jgi:ribosomal protein L11 methyltransferase
MEQIVDTEQVQRVLNVEVPLQLAEAMAAALEALEPAPDAVGYFEAGSGRAELSAYYTGAPDRSALEDAIRAVAPESDIGPLRLETVPDADWVTISQGQRPHVRAGRFTVHGSHEAIAPGRGVLEIDASCAFGTAHHASTKGCLLALDAILKRRSPILVLDIGTGTGVLAIAAAKQSRACVIGTDNDPISIRIARENAQKNGTPSVRFLVAQGFDHKHLRRLRGDLVFGNLLQSILFDLAHGFAAHVAPDGLAVLSGITDGQAASVEARYRALGFVLENRVRLDGWTTLVLRRVSRAGSKSDRAKRD